MIDYITGTSLIWVFNFLVTIYVIFYGRKNPKSTLTWVLVINALPILGFIIFLFIGTNQRNAKMFRLKKEDDEIITKLGELQYELIEENKFKYKKRDSAEYDALIKMNLYGDNAYYTENNDIEIYNWGKDKFKALMKDIKEAEHSIDIQYYIFRSDKLGKSIISLLEEKLKEGLKVRLLVDAIGSRGFRKKYLRRYLALGGEYIRFYPPILRIFNPKINYRNHRKIVVIDDKIAYIGGFNVGDDYLGKYKNMGPWRDTHLRLEGSAVIGLKLRFLKDWYYSNNNNIDMDSDIISQNISIKGNKAVQIVTSGPDTEFQNIKNLMLYMINSAKKSIYIQTPYLVPDASIMEAIKMAIIKGVSVNIMIPSKPDHIIIYWATTSFARELVELGANVYTYDEGFLHAKVVVVDNLLATVGSANLDERSFALNFEANAVIYSKEINAKLKAQFYIDLEKCTKLTVDLMNKRPLHIRIKEPIARLFAPIL